jgi:transmembrane sensor
VKRPEPDSPEAMRRSEEAAGWLACCDRGLTAAEQDDFLQWLAADQRHGEWLAVHRAVVGDFTAFALWRPEHREEPNPDLLAPPRRRPRWQAPAVLAAAAVVAIGMTLWRGESGSAATPLARRLLEDGSAVELNRGAIVRDAFTAEERRLELMNGEAYFSVAKNPDRPFTVRAGGVEVRAVGTEFSVRLDAGTVEVIVTEGRVGVRREFDRASSATAGDAAFVDAGHKATVSLTAGTLPHVSVATSAQTSRHLGGQAQLLDFSSAPLAVAVTEFNRRNRVQFEITDVELAALPIVASIRSDNVEGFAQFLAAAPGLQVERSGPDVIIVRRKR